jgi:hypothetical protein
MGRRIKVGKREALSLHYGTSHWLHGNSILKLVAWKFYFKIGCMEILF